MKKILLLAMTAILIFTTGCDPQQPPTEKPDPPKQTQNENPEKKSVPEKKDNPSTQKKDSDQKFQTQEIKIFYPDENATKLVEVKRTIKFVDENEKYSAALSELMQTPKEQGLINIFPKHTKIKSVTRKDDTAIVDFDKDIVKNFVGGSTGEEFLVNSVVDTLTEFDEINQVRFLIDGQEIETLSGHMDLSEPVKRTKE